MREKQQFILPKSPDLEFEKKHRAQQWVVAGVDEVGRGCLAGPVVTAAVVLPDFLFADADSWKSTDWGKLNDSKKLSPTLRKHLSLLIHKHALVQIAWCFPDEIDRWNILHASMIAMRRALYGFRGHVTSVLVDGHQDPFHPMFRCRPTERERLGLKTVETLVKGDQRSLSIAAASIVAKVYRDEWMSELHTYFPQYSFDQHKGYSTPTHYKAIEAHGACGIHRLSFSPFKTVQPTKA